MKTRKFLDLHQRYIGIGKKKLWQQDILYGFCGILQDEKTEW